MQEKEHVIEVLQQAKKAAKVGNIFNLKNLSNQTIHSASIYEDSDNIIVAVVIYTLSKLIERKANYSEKDYEQFLSYYIDILDKSIVSISKNDFNGFRENIKNLMKKTDKLSEHMRESLKDMFRKARINKASKIYEHGLSMEKTAKLLDISLWELAEYTGQSGVSETNLNKTLDVKKRIKNAMEIFE